MTHDEMQPLLAALDQLRIENDKLRAAIEEYAQHASWKCDDPGWPWPEGHCPCGLTHALDLAGVPLLDEERSARAAGKGAALTDAQREELRATRAHWKRRWGLE